jgi:hypothetical protein
MIRTFLALCLLAVSSANLAAETARGDSLAKTPDSLRMRKRAASSLPVWSMEKDSLAFYEYRHIGDIAVLASGASLFGLGIEGQPSWLSSQGSLPRQFALVEDGIDAADIVTGSTTFVLSGTEDAERVIVHPAHESFWRGGNGMATTVELRRRRWKASRPFTRLRHTEAPYDYLGTDIIFNVNPSPDGMLHIGINRQTNGTSGSTNPARYSQSRFETWLTRLEYTDRISSRFSIELRHEYGDALVYQNGGILGARSSADTNAMAFPDRGAANAEENAFNPILAALANPTMNSQIRRHLALAGASVDWDGDSSHVTSARFLYRSQSRHFSDGLAFAADSRFTGDDITSDDSWHLAEAQLHHSSEIGPLTLDANGRAGYFNADYRYLGASSKGLLVSAGAMATASIGSWRTRLFGRIDHSMEITTAGIGAGIDASLFEGFGFWGGASVSSRPPTAFERGYRSARTSIVGASSDGTDRTAVVEAGLRQSCSWTTNLLTVTYQRTTSPLRLTAGYSFDASRGSPIRFLTSFQYGQWHSDAVNISLVNTLSWWLLTLESRGRITVPLNQNSWSVTLPVPKREIQSALSFRGNLIEGTLDLKTGVSASICSAYVPAVYDPETDMFLLPSLSESESAGISSYTSRAVVDAFLFATIKGTATLHLVVHNLFDARYITTAMYPMHERSFRFGVDWTLFD